MQIYYKISKLQNIIGKNVRNSRKYQLEVCFCLALLVILGFVGWVNYRISVKFCHNLLQFLWEILSFSNYFMYLCRS